MLLDLSTFGILLRTNILTLDLIPLVNCACILVFLVFLDLVIYLEIKCVAGFKYIWCFVKNEYNKFKSDTSCELCLYISIFCIF